MDQSQNNPNPALSGSTNPPVATPTSPVPPTAPSTPTTPTTSPSTLSPAPSVEPAEIPPAPPAVDYPSSGGSSVSRTIFLFLALLLVGGALYAGYWYMNQQTNSTYQQPVVTPTEVPATITPTVATSGASLQEEQDLQQINLGSDEAQITDVQKDINGL